MALVLSTFDLKISLILSLAVNKIQKGLWVGLFSIPHIFFLYSLNVAFFSVSSKEGRLFQNNKSMF